jgi:hypothetical protein
MKTGHCVDFPVHTIFVNFFTINLSRYIEILTKGVCIEKSSRVLAT